MSELWLSEEEVREVTKRQRPSAQARVLDGMGVPYLRRPNGTLIVGRRAYAAATQPPLAEMPVGPSSPDGGMRADWSETPLGQWQTAQRAARREQEREIAKERAAQPKPTARERRESARQELQRKREAHSALIRHHSGRRRAAKLHRTPPWADMDAIHAIYVRARQMSQETGIPHHVDHEIPLQGKLVSGLHVHNNLQILTGVENSRKRNRYEVQP